MTHDPEEVVPGGDWTRIARTPGLLVVILGFRCFLMTLYGLLLAGDPTSLDIDGAFEVLVYALGLLAGTIIAYSRERAGGIVIIAITIAPMIWIYVAYSVPLVDMLLLGLLLGGLPLVAGVLFLVSGREAKREATRATSEWRSRRRP